MPTALSKEEAGLKDQRYIEELGEKNGIADAEEFVGFAWGDAGVCG